MEKDQSNENFGPIGESYQDIKDLILNGEFITKGEFKQRMRKTLKYM